MQLSDSIYLTHGKRLLTLYPKGSNTTSSEGRCAIHPVHKWPSLPRFPVNAWADINDEERQLLLGDSVAADCVYTDALAQCHGHAELTAHIRGFQQGLPGGRFETELFVIHHNHALAGWHPVDANGTVQPSGVDAVIFNADGLLAQITGFPVALTK